MSISKKIISFLIVLIAVAIYFGCYTVPEGYKAVVNNTKIVGPGLHFYIPFVNSVNKVDMRLQITTDSNDKQTFYTVWRITDPTINNKQVVDKQITNTVLSKTAKEQIIKNMQTILTQIADNKSQQGKIQVADITANAEAGAALIIAKAKEQVAELKSAADKAAFAIYEQAFGKDLEFYKYYSNLQMYKNTLNNKQDILILRPGFLKP